MITMLLSAVAALQPVPQSQVELVNLVPEYDAFAAAIAPLPDITPGPALRAHFAPVIPGYYATARNPEIDGYIEQSLAAWPEKREAVLAVADRFEREFAPALVAFEKEFGTLPGAHKVWLVNSLGEFDGAVRNLEQGPALMFGADVIERIHGDNRLGPLFVHEFFHGYHGMNWDGCDELACNLWTEGLAVHVARSLYPDASEGELLLVIPEPIKAKVDADLPGAACAVHALLDDTSSDAYRQMFSFGTPPSGFPPRFGYYVGSLVAAKLGETRSLKELASMDSATLRPLIAQTLAEMGGGCA